VDHTPLPPSAEAELRAHARVRAVHYSTFIEGNRLTMSQAKAAIADANLEIAESGAGRLRGSKLLERPTAR